MYQGILLDVKDRIATVSFNNPTQRNAMTHATYQEIIDVMAECDSRDDIAVIIVTGVGDHFCAGGNIRNFREIINSKTYIQEEGVRTTNRMVSAIRRCGKPVIAMVNGVAAGLGMGIALGCDMRVVTPSTKMIAAFVNIGLPGDTTIQYNLQMMVGASKTMEFMMTGEPISGEEAFKLGLANRMAPEGKLLETTMELATTLSKKALLGMRCQKQLMYETFFREIEPYADREAYYMRYCSMSNDFEEAVNAFLDKREPKFTGK